MKNLRVILLAVVVLTAVVGASGAAAGAHPAGAEFEHTESESLSADYSGQGPTQTAENNTCGFPLNVTDATGTEITLDERPDRITTTNPSAAQTLWELGAQDRVVGVTEFAGYLNGTASKTNVSAEFGVSVEKVVATNPDLVLAPNASAGQVEDLRAQNLTVYHFPAATDIDDIAAKTERTGRLVGNCETAAEVNNEMNQTVEDLKGQTAELDRPGALYPLGGGFVAADNTFINEIMKIGGTTNVAASEADGYPQLSDEVILKTDPEIILVTDTEGAILDKEPYASTTAGAEDNYVVMNTNYLNQPAPRSVIESTKTLAAAVEDLQANKTKETVNSSDTCGFPLTVTDATGTEITLDERPDRITTTNPSAAQTLWELGAQDRVVGVTEFAGYLNGTASKANVSAEFGVSVEKVVATNPDLVLAPNASAGQVADLRTQNLTVYHFSAATDVDDIAAKTERTGRLVGNCETAAEVNTEMNQTVENVENQTAGLDRPDALYPLGGGFVAADNTFINEIMEIGGTTNVAASEADGYPQLSDEVILQTNPELLIVTDSEATILDRQPYASTNAGENNNYVVLNTNYLNQPAPRSVIESTKTLANGVTELQSEDTKDDGGRTDGSSSSRSDDDDRNEEDERDEVVDTNETTVDTNETTVDTNETTVDTNETTVDTNETTVDENETPVNENETATDTSSKESTTSAEPNGTSNQEGNETETSNDVVNQKTEQDDGPSNTTDEGTESEVPGFGVVVTVLVILGFAYLSPQK
ncbi:PGF-CTERM-anchored ABC transporter substrate-binding protein [Halorubrum distributum]|uniref:PGF-CTERM-anchored ABC transporter substrate-binding protein n=1 Tax=Halorubrum distributum TaxID=29283 RepID=UPI00295593CF|nr:PGF-CTERM-anchored ABC transporter substrate-binding protein [Halorubrum distributum]MDV7351176.1 PGF-CTERM-anchored ABC transporter substrate-binding protein [Halorubrum distributum]